MYTLISGSPKLQNSNSKYFLDFISSNLKDYKMYELKNSKYEDIINNIKNSHTVIFSFPLYVDSPPSLMLSFLDYIYDNRIDLLDKKIYVIVNCGFREGEQNIAAVNIMKCWCEKVNVNYMGSISIGAGEIVGKSKYRFISNKAIKKLSMFKHSVESGNKCKDIITTMDLLNNKMYCKLANMSWKNKVKKNNLTYEDTIG